MDCGMAHNKLRYENMANNARFPTTFQFRGLVRQTFVALRHDWRMFLAFAIVLAIPLSLANEYFFPSGNPVTANVFALVSSDNFYALAFFNTLIGAFADAVFIYLTASAIVGKWLSPQKLLKKAANIWGVLVMTLLLKGVVVLGLSVLLIIPGIIWLNYYTFVTQLVIINEKKWKSALDASKQLVRGHWWEVLGVNITVWLYYIGVSMGMGWIFSTVLSGESLLHTVTLNMFVNIFGMAGTVFLTLYFYHLYNAKREEGE